MNPWSNIGTPDTQNGYTAILADPEHPFDFYWGRNIDGDCVFRFMGTFSPNIYEDAPIMSGLEVKSGIETARTHLTLVLETSENSKIFYYLCTSLMDATKKIKSGNDTAAAGVILTHLSRWQKLLKNQGSKFLSLQQQMGLFGELVVLKDFFLANLPEREAISCWAGPLGDEQDFGYGNSLVEVKTVRSTRDREINISSIAQLDAVSGDISLVFQTIGVFEDQPPETMSLNSIVAIIVNILTEASVEILDQFWMRLAMVGYEAVPEYEKYHFALVSRRVFAVEGDFPRIVSTDIREGVTKATYSILVDSCLPFELSLQEALERILENVTEPILAPVSVAPEILIKLDESRILEFKSSLRYCLKTKKPEKYIEKSIIKSIAAFANSSGGQLIVGVNEDEGVFGLENDFQSLRQKNRDGFELHLSTLLVNAFGEVFTANNISTIFHKITGKDICVITIEQSNVLQFVEHQNKTGEKTNKLYVRIGSSSREIPPEKIQEYVGNRSSNLPSNSQ